MTKIFITLDYELFFGKKSGSVENCIIIPTEKLISILNTKNIKASFFVDSGYLLKLEELMDDFPVLKKDYNKITFQLRSLSNEGHDLQLHIHPHWEDSYFDGKKWIFNTSRYRISSFNQNEIEEIVRKHKLIIQKFAKNKVFAFRAGGWCIQPFYKLKKAFIKNNIWLDSTVFKNGKNSTKTHYYDFVGAPEKSIWKFDEDPLVETKQGFFTEIPISSVKVSPLFFWFFAFFKKFGGKYHKSFGDGVATQGTLYEKFRKLLWYSNSVVSIDGFKSILIKRAYKNYTKKNKENFVLIGHPKALSEYSLNILNKFINQKKLNFTTYSNFYKNEN
jgi:hypothetical protein